MRKRDRDEVMRKRRQSHSIMRKRRQSHSDDVNVWCAKVAMWCLKKVVDLTINYIIEGNIYH